MMFSQIFSVKLKDFENIFCEFNSRNLPLFPPLTTTTHPFLPTSNHRFCMKDNQLIFNYSKPFSQAIIDLLISGGMRHEAGGTIFQTLHPPQSLRLIKQSMRFCRQDSQPKSEYLYPIPENIISFIDGRGGDFIQSLPTLNTFDLKSCFPSLLILEHKAKVIKIQIQHSQTPFPPQIASVINESHKVFITKYFRKPK